MEFNQIAVCPGGVLYALRSGDTFCSLARRFRVTLPQLIKANPTMDPDILHLGKLICIPTQGSRRIYPGTLYQVQSEDTLLGVARRFQLGVQQLLDANPRLDPNALSPGQLLCIPDFGYCERRYSISDSSQ